MNINVPQEVRDALEGVIVGAVSNDNEEATKNDDISPVSETLMRTVTIRSVDKLPTVVEGTQNNNAARVLEFPSTAVDNNVGAVLLSEEISESLFLDGYDSDGLLHCYVDQGEDLIKLEQYNSTQPGKEFGSNGIAEGGGDDGELFVFCQTTISKSYELMVYERK